MKVSSILAVVLAGSAMAGKLSGPFTSKALHTINQLKFQPIQARNHRLFIGGDPKTYCPLASDGDPTTKCPPSSETAIQLDLSTNEGFMDVEVPGGQQLYVLPNGAIAYTIAHSGLPDGVYTKGFRRAGPVRKGVPGYWTFQGQGATGLLACPTLLHGHYQIFADVKGFTKTNCVALSATAVRYDHGLPAAWQYE